MRRSATTRFCCFATVHAPATLLLMEKLEAAGLYGYVGKVSMNRNAPVELCELGDLAARDCEAWLTEARRRFSHVLPIITPRFIPACTDTLMKSLSELMRRYAMPLQSHLSENRTEIRWVEELCPDTGSYAGAYDRFGMLTPRSVMAHVVYPEADEMELLREHGVMVAHCPASNMNLAQRHRARSQAAESGRAGRAGYRCRGRAIGRHVPRSDRRGAGQQALLAAD